MLQNKLNEINISILSLIIKIIESQPCTNYLRQSSVKTKETIKCAWYYTSIAHKVYEASNHSKAACNWFIRSLKENG